MTRAAAVFMAILLNGCATPHDRHEDTVAALHARASGGDVRAMLDLAWRHLGPGFSSGYEPSPSQRDQAIEWFRRASERGSTGAMNQLAHWLVDAGERAEADRWMRRAIAAGDARGVGATARLRRDGDESAVRLSTEWLRLAAATGSDDARAAFDAALRERPDLRRSEDEPLLPAIAGDAPTTSTDRVADLAPVLPVVSRGDPLAEGVRHWREGRHDDARAAALATLRHRRDEPHALLLLAACDLARASETPSLGRAHLDRAIAGLERARDADPTDAAVWAALATAETWRALAGSDWPSDAVSAVEAAAYLDPAHTSLAATVRARVRSAPFEPRALIARHLVLRAGARPSRSEAEADLELALSHRPGDVRALLGRARLKTNRGDLAGALADLNAASPDRQTESQLVLRARLGELAGVEAELSQPSDLRAVLRLLLDRRAEALMDLELVGAHLWLAGLGADPRRHWRDVCEGLAARPRVDGDVLAARLHLGRLDPTALQAWADGLPASDDRAWQRLAAYLHLGLDAERRSDLAAARAAYAECVSIVRRVADETPWAWSIHARPEHVWAEARLRAISD